MSKEYDGDDMIGIVHCNKSIPLYQMFHRQADRHKFSTYLLQAHEVRDYTVFSNTVILMGTTHGLYSYSNLGGGLPDVNLSSLACTISRRS